MAATKAILFDFDGVVADTWKLHQMAWATVLQREGIELTPDMLIDSLGLSEFETARRLVTALELALPADTLAMEKREVFVRASKKGLDAMPGALAAMQRLHGEFQLGVVATRVSTIVQPFLQQCTMQPLLETIISIDHLTRDQDLDVLFTKAVSELGLKPEQVVVVDDTRNGILAAKRAKLRSIAFDSNPEHSPDYSAADAQITALDELIPELVNQVLR